jgi:hypothetical protein
MDEGRKLRLKKELVSKSLGIEIEASATVRTTGDRAAPAAAAEPENCAKCGKPLKPGAKFCPGCGAKVEALAQKTEAQPAQPPAGESKKADRISFRRFINRPADRAVSYPTPGNICWCLAFVLFAAASRLPLGTIPPIKTNIGISMPQQIDFPTILWIPFLLIFISMVLSIVNLKFPGGGAGNKRFRLSFLAAVTVYNFIFLRAQLLAGAWDLMSVYIVFLLIYFVSGRAKSYFEKFEQYSAAVLLMGGYVLLVSFFLKTDMLTHTGANPVNNVGFYLLLFSSILIVAGSFFKRNEITETEYVNG